MNKFKFFFFALFLLFVACGDNGTMTPTPAENLATISINGGSTIIEGAGTSALQFEVKASMILETGSDVDYTVTGTATPGADFTETTGTISIAAGSNSGTISIPILDDEINEVEEKVTVTLMTASNATIETAIAVGIIKDNDQPSNFDAEGYVTPSE